MPSPTIHLQPINVLISNDPVRTVSYTHLGIKGVENCKKHYVDICNIVQGDVSAEVIATDYEGMIKA